MDAKDVEIVRKVQDLYLMGKSLGQISRVIGAEIDTYSGQYTSLHDEILAGKIKVNGREITA